MLTLVCCLVLMLLVALALLSFTFIRHRESFLKLFSLTAIFLSTSLSLYFYQCNFSELQNWLNGGNRHYALLSKINNLGGIDEIIQKIQSKLAANPDDFTGWIILCKLYLGKHNYAAAADALHHATALQPQSVQVKELTEMLIMNR